MKSKHKYKMQILDDAFDVMLLLLTALCFVAAGISVIQAILNITSLINSIVFIAQGMALSWFYIWLKAKSGS